MPPCPLRLSSEGVWLPRLDSDQQPFAVGFETQRLVQELHIRRSFLVTATNASVTPTSDTSD